MEHARFVIAGGGMVAGYAAKEMAQLGLKPGELTIVSEDTALPYERPPLSKGFLAGRESEESIRINSAEFYREHGIEVRLGLEIARIHPQQKRLILKNGAELEFEKLMIATGARPRTLDIPGAQLPRVYYLRSLADSQTIRKGAEGAKHAAVIGGGFIGMEVAAVLAQKKIEVAMIVREGRIWERFFTPQMSRFFEAYYTQRGVRLLTNAGLREFRGQGALESAVLSDGRTIPCDIVVAGIGVQPEIGWLAHSGVEVGDGVMVNEYLETNRPGILAAGDVANYQDILFGKRRRVEHWDNAVSQGQHAAHLLMGERTPFRHVPYFFSDVFDLSYEFWGDPSGAEERIHRGDLSSNSFSVWWIRQGALVAAFAMNRPDEERESAMKWIEQKQRVSAAKLENASSAISSAVEA